MNPDTTIKTWLLACGEQYGIKHAFDYRWPDVDARKKEMFCTYRIMSSVPLQDGTQDMSTRDAFTAQLKHAQKWLTTVQIDLHNSQDGLFELASFVVALKGNPTIRAILDDQCSLREAISCVNMSDFTDEEITYLHRLICTFEEDITFELDDANAIVETIELTLSDGYGTQIITDDGYYGSGHLVASDGDLVVSGSAYLAGG